MGPIKNQDLNRFIEFLENQFINFKQECDSKISSIKVLLLTDENEPLDDDKLSTLFIRLYRFGRYKCYKIRNFLDDSFVVIKETLDNNLVIVKENLSNISIPTIKKKSILLASTCIISAASTFMFISNKDLFSVDVSAQSETVNTTETTANTESFPTISVNGQRFATDGKVVSEQLNNYDFYNNGKKVVYLTFDDGPTKYTPEILSILKKYNIRGTFFTTGTALENGGEEMKKVLKESYAYGNSIGNHTYSHDYKTLYPNGSLDLNAFNTDLERNLTLLRGALGENFNTNIVRCPGGFNSWSNMTPLKEQLDSNNQASIDWNALTGDSSKIKNSVKDMIAEAKTTSEDKNLVVLLMHETNKYTPEYLDEIIRYYYNNGYEFRTIA